MTAISPNYNTEDFPDGIKTIDEKIDIFEDKIKGWQLNLAKYLIDQEQENRVFAELMIIFSYFEMIELFYSGTTVDDHKRSKARAIKGIQRVFPEKDFKPVKKDISKEEEEKTRSKIKNVYKYLYEYLRCGLYHQGSPRENISFDFTYKQTISLFGKEYLDGRDDSLLLMMINPDTLVNKVLEHFDKYIMELRNPKNTRMRNKFVKRFDYQFMR